MCVCVLFPGDPESSDLWGQTQSRSCQVCPRKEMRFLWGGKNYLETDYPPTHRQRALPACACEAKTL